ncbi:MAG: TolC family protein [Verrucomicrobia bacterium]|nr:TolC family protein [Verrucomicrobiota bacterium]
MKCRTQLFGLLALLALQAQAESVYTLDDCIRIGLKRAVPVQNAARDQEIAEATMKKARSGALPQINLSATYTRNDGTGSSFVTNDVLRDSYSATASVSQKIYDGGKVFSAIRAAGAYRGLTAEARAQQEAALVRNIHFGFNRILLAQSTVAVQEASVQQLEDFADQAKQKYDAGTASEFDRLTAQVRLANEKPKFIEARNALAIAKEAFRNLIVLDEKEFQIDGQLDYQPADLDPVTLQSTAVASRPELLVQENTIALRREDLNSAWGGYKPTVTASAYYTRENPDRYDSTRDQWENHWQADVTAAWKLFDGGSRRGEVLTKGLELAKAQADRDNLLRAVSLEVTQAWLDLTAARETIAGATETVTLAEKALEIAKTRYDAGLSTYLEFTDSNLSLNTARLTWFQALEKHRNAVTQLKYAAGILGE